MTQPALPDNVALAVLKVCGRMTPAASEPLLRQGCDGARTALPMSGFYAGVYAEIYCAQPLYI